MKVISCFLMGYFVGNINPAYLMSKAKGFDIRDQGSGNAGASNVTVMMGKSFGFFCAILDILKGVLSYKAARLIFPVVVYAGAVAGAGAILGHIFPFWMEFRGGKGLATLAGVAWGYNWKFFLIVLLFEAVFILITQYIALVSVSACVIVPIGYGFMTHDGIGTAALLVVMAAMLYKHRENLYNIAHGREVRISYLWNPEAELERLKDIYPEGLDSAR